MSSPSTITRRHLDRLAMIYVRQSTLTQVREHHEASLGRCATFLFRTFRLYCGVLRTMRNFWGEKDKSDNNGRCHRG